MRIHFLLLILAGTTFIAQAQHSSIKPDSGCINCPGTEPDASAVLEIQATDRGILIPRVANTAAVSKPVTGLLVYDLSAQTFTYYNGTVWRTFGSEGLSLTEVDNTFVGVEAGISNTGSNNTAVGRSALKYTTTGNDNTALGRGALLFNTEGSNNTAVGRSTLYYNTTGSDNTAAGRYALWNNTEGSGNTVQGHSAMYFNTTGNSNVGIGIRALYRNTERSNLVAVGDSALFNNGQGATAAFQGAFNTALGSKSLFFNTLGRGNTATGASALYYNTGGEYNAANGYLALNRNEEGDANTAMGSSTLFSNTSGSYNTAAGWYALYANTEGDHNTALGRMAMFSNTTGNRNIAIGQRALYQNVNGSNLIAIGDSAMYRTGYDNTPPYPATTYSTENNIAIGSKALYENLSGSNNIAIGLYALSANTGGSGNIAIGSFAMPVEHSGVDNTAIGFNARIVNHAASTFTNSTAIGAFSLANGNSRVVLGSMGIAQIGGYVNWSNISDARFKAKIREDVPGLPFIRALRPVTYQMKMQDMAKLMNIPDRFRQLEEETAKSAIRYTGFLAQEVDEAAQAVNYDFSGVLRPEHKHDHYSLRYAEFVVPLVKAVQELDAQNEALQVENKQKDEKIAELEARLARIEALLTEEDEPDIQRSSLNSRQPQLGQNQPNPFSGHTTIPYFIPEVVQQAQLRFHDLQGRVLKTIEVSGRGDGLLDLDTAGLAAGAYTYSLVLDGQLFATKQMIVHR